MSKVHYVDNKKLYTEMVKFHRKCQEVLEEEGEDFEFTKNPDRRPKVPEYAGEAIFKIANRLSTRPQFIGYSFREELVGDGIENALTYIHNFDPDKSKNPFAYFTQIIYYAFLRRIQKEIGRAHV